MKKAYKTPQVMMIKTSPVTVMSASGEDVPVKEMTIQTKVGEIFDEALDLL